MFDEAASNDERLIWNERRPANIEPPPVHYHPDTEERFEVNEGLLVVEIEGEPHQVEASEEIVIPPATPHVSYTEASPARFRREVSYTEASEMGVRMDRCARLGTRPASAITPFSADELLAVKQSDPSYGYASVIRLV